MARSQGGLFLYQIPAVTMLGEQFYLPKEEFSEGAIGEVTEIVAQSAGRTTVRMKLIEGQMIPKHQRQSRPSQPVWDEGAEIIQKAEVIPFVTPREMFERGHKQAFAEPGGPPTFANLDPRPRTGVENRVVTPDPQQQTPPTSVFLAPPEASQESQDLTQSLQGLPPRGNNNSRGASRRSSYRSSAAMQAMESKYVLVDGQLVPESQVAIKGGKIDGGGQ